MWGSSKNNKRGNELINMFVSNDLAICNTGNSPTFSTITHGTSRQSIIDLTLASESLACRINQWTVDTSKEVCPSSQHHAIQYRLELHQLPPKNKTQTTFKYHTKDADWDSFAHQLNINMNRANLTDATIINTLNKDQLETYIHKITKTIQDTCVKKLPTKSKYRTHAPWWTEELEQLKLQLIQLHHEISRHKHRGLPLDALINERDDKAKEYSTTIRSTSTAHFREFCNRQGKENVWSLTNRLLKNAPAPKPPATMRIDGKHTTSAQSTAAALLNKFFPDDTADNMVQADIRNTTHTAPNTTDDPPFTENEVIACLQTMNPNRAPGTDHLTSDICLTFAQTFPTIITGIMNRCLELEYFPNTWKTAFIKIIPKPNKTDYTDMASFRPIGLINVLGKTLEKLIAKRITYHLGITESMNPRQFGFKEQKSTIEALHTAIGIINIAKKTKKQTLAVSLDIQAAFDNAWWPALLNRLHKTNCPRNIYLLINNYINNRHVRMHFADSEATKLMTRGCIQGSVLGPLIWNLILDDLLETELPDGCYIQAYADDVLMIAQSNTVNNLETITNTALNKIYTWGQEVKLRFGPSKTQMVAFTPKAKNACIQMHGQTIKFQDELKLLGVIIDKKLTFIKHIHHATSKAYKIYNSLCKFIRPTWGIHSENVRIIYKHVIQPIITYAAGIWHTATNYKHVRMKLKSFQRGFAIKAIRGFRTISGTAAIALAAFTPLHIKINEVASVETAKLTARATQLPEDITLERPSAPHELLHPSERVHLDIPSATTQQDTTQFYTPGVTTRIYTDGSKQDGLVGAALVIYSPNNDTKVKKYKLHDTCSVYQAELLAIAEACSWIDQHHTPDTTIFTDSMSATQEISNPNSTNPFVVHIHKMYRQAIKHSRKITFVWVKAHVGIDGNEAADVAAKAAAHSHAAYKHTQFPISLIRYMAKQNSRLESDTTYATGEKGQYTRNLLPNTDAINKLRAAIEIDFPWTQVLTGHGYCRQYLHRFKISDTDKCPCDPHTTQTFAHLIQKCPRFAASRHKHEVMCHHHDVEEYNIDQLIENANCIKTYSTLIHDIVYQLKEYNTPQPAVQDGLSQL
ncbi:hypothetical protein O3G_MSEX015484 [Manduca sexta]|uniref:Uncharacterized protein n=1 Tax=Manduca sexta TaxID=7130 RepID=A0A922D605_MANSE|nr:hypothetical protein O3G_MSEX015484 [Manduca sexta]